MVKQYTRSSEIRNLIYQTKVEIELYNPHKYSTAILIFKDMLFYLQIWRQVKGYSKNNQRTHSNNKTNKKKKTINNFRLQQFYRLFGRKRRDIFPTLIIAEYTNRLWYLVWHEQWISAWGFICNLALKNKNIVKFDPQMLSKNIVTGLPAVKKKKKHNTAKKKLIAVATLGLPILFSLFLYNYKNVYKFPFKLVIGDDSRKKMGKKQKKNKKK